MAREIRDEGYDLAQALIKAKAVEAEAKAERVRIEEELANLLGGKEIGASSFRCGDIDVTVTRKMNYTISDAEALASINPDVVKRTVKFEVISKAYEQMRLEDPANFARAAEFVTATPAKVAVKI